MLQAQSAEGIKMSGDIRHIQDRLVKQATLIVSLVAGRLRHIACRLPPVLASIVARLVRVASSAMHRIAELGTAGYEPEDKRRLKILNLIAALVVVATGIYAVQHTLADFQKYRPLILINAGLVVVALSVPILHRVGPATAGVTLVICEFIGLWALSAYLSRDAGLHLQYLIAAAATFVALGPERLRLVVVIITAGLVIHLVIWFRHPLDTALLKVDHGELDALYVQAAVTTVALIAATVWYAFSLVEEARGETDALLRNILPDSIVARIKQKPADPIADSFEDASILFTDIAGFVPLSRELGAARVVALLNRVVSDFDALATKHGIEKIKTIGDAYMAAGGLPARTPGHLGRLVEMALDMLVCVAKVRNETGLDIQIRIGIAAGQVMAGIIGSQKFSYDVWGDTVNLAARLERTGTPGRILVCPACRARLADTFDLQPHGTIDIKGIGLCETWTVVGRKHENPLESSAAASAIVNPARVG